MGRRFQVEGLLREGTDTGLDRIELETGPRGDMRDRAMQSYHLATMGRFLWCHFG